MSASAAAPNFFRLALAHHGGASFRASQGAPGTVWRAEPLRYDALEPKLAGMAGRDAPNVR